MIIKTIKQPKMKHLTDFMHDTFTHGSGVTFGICGLIAYFGHMVLAFSNATTWEYVIKMLMGLMAIFCGGIVGEIGKRVGGNIIRKINYFTKNKKDGRDKDKRA